MKIFWKLFFSTAMVMTITFCIAGYVMISAFFESSYARSSENAENINRIFLHAFGNYIGNISGKKKDITEDIETLTDEFLEKDTQVQITDENKNILYDNLFLTDDRSGTAIAKQLLHTEENYFLRVVNCVQVGKKSYYVATYHNMTPLFKERGEQLTVYRRALLYLPGISGIVSWILSGMLVRPLGRISKSARRIADGNLDYRITVRSEDEIGSLAIDFNRMADSLQGKINELEEISKRQEEFIGSFAHELKTPLTSIIGYADLLRSEKQTEEERFLCASYIFQEGGRLERLSLRLLELIVLNNKELSYKEIYLAELFEDVEGMMKPVLQKQNIILEVSRAEFTLELEAELFRTVLINLIDNSRKAITQEGHIWLTGREEGEFCYIEVADDGQGIPKEEITHITDAFYMVDKSRSRSQGGVGLGLSICERIVNLHGGTMEFSARDGGGTTVQIKILKNHSQGE